MTKTDQPNLTTLIEKLEALIASYTPPEWKIKGEAVSEAIEIIRTHLSNQPPADKALEAVKEALEEIAETSISGLYPRDNIDRMHGSRELAKQALSSLPAIESALNKPKVSLEKCGNAAKAIFDLSLVGPDTGFKPEDVAKAVLDALKEQGVRFDVE